MASRRLYGSFLDMKAIAERAINERHALEAALEEAVGELERQATIERGPKEYATWRAAASLLRTHLDRLRGES